MNHTKKLEGNFYEAFFLIIYAHNALTQLNSIFFLCLHLFFLSLHFRNQKEMACAIKTAEWEIRRGNHRFLQFFFLSFFSGYSKWKKKSATNVFVYSVFIKMYVVKHTRGMKMKMWKNKKIFPRLQLCIEKKKKIEMRENEKKKLKNVHRPQIAGYSWW